MSQRVLDIFCGAAGGWSLGLHRAGFETVAACEIDPWRRAVFSHNNPGVLMYGDVRELTASGIVSDLGYLPEIICGSPPCQDASTANTTGRGVDGARTGLFAEAIRLVRELRPRWALLENVPGLRARGYDWIANELEEAGYAVWPLVVGAVHAGAPHLRKRVWIVAKSNSVDGRANAAGYGLPAESAELQHADREACAGHGSPVCGNELGPAAKSASHGCGPGRAGRFNSSDARQSKQTFHAANADCDQSLESQMFAAHASQPIATGRGETGGRGLRQEENAGSGVAADAVREGMGERLGGANGERAILPIEGPLQAFRDWNGGPPAFGDVDDGVPATLASRRGLGRACLAAYGDSVVPQITEAIGRAVLALEAEE